MDHQPDLAVDSRSGSESPLLEFKRAESLNLKESRAKKELPKDVSAFANAAGGTIIYGLAENTSKHPPVAEQLDPVPIEWATDQAIENVLTSRIEPIIPGVRISPLPAEPGFVWVVDIPEGRTAHQVVGSGVYYYRHNFKAEPMPDHLVRHVMNRGYRPLLEVVVEEEGELQAFGWMKTVGLLAKLRHRGLAKASFVFTFTAACYNLVRMRSLMPQFGG